MNTEALSHSCSLLRAVGQGREGAVTSGFATPCVGYTLGLLGSCSWPVQSLTQKWAG